MNGKRPSSASQVPATLEERKPAPVVVLIKEKMPPEEKYSDDSELEVDKNSTVQSFVRLSDLDSSSRTDTSCEARNNSKNEERDCEHTMLDLNRTGLMSRSIPPPQSFVESPLFLSMSRSVAAYRSTPAPFNSQTQQRLTGLSSK